MRLFFLFFIVVATFQPVYAEEEVTSIDGGSAPMASVAPDAQPVPNAPTTTTAPVEQQAVEQPSAPVSSSPSDSVEAKPQPEAAFRLQGFSLTSTTTTNMVRVWQGR